MGQAAEAMNWVMEQRQAQAEQLKQEGFIVYDVNGDPRLTEKGNRRYGSRMDRLPVGDDLLIEIKVCEAYGVTARL